MAVGTLDKPKTEKKKSKRTPAPITVEIYKGEGGEDGGTSWYVPSQPEHPSTASAIRWASENLGKNISTDEQLTIRIIQTKKTISIESERSVKMTVV